MNFWSAGYQRASVYDLWNSPIRLAILMSIPDYQTIMLPLLRLASDGGEHRLSEALGDLARMFNLSADEVAERVPSGKQSVLSNRAKLGQNLLVASWTPGNAATSLFSHHG